jgi:hypothetical protein
MVEARSRAVAEQIQIHCTAAVTVLGTAVQYTSQNPLEETAKSIVTGYYCQS